MGAPPIADLEVEFEARRQTLFNLQPAAKQDVVRLLRMLPSRVGVVSGVYANRGIGRIVGFGASDRQVDGIPLKAKAAGGLGHLLAASDPVVISRVVLVLHLE